MSENKFARTNQRPAFITDRELDVCWHLAMGKTDKQVAEHLGISESTVKYHLNNVRLKVKGKTRTEIVVKLIALGALDLEELEVDLTNIDPDASRCRQANIKVARERKAARDAEFDRRNAEEEAKDERAREQQDGMEPGPLLWTGH